VADVGDDDDVLRVRRIDGDRLLRLVQVALADVDVRGGRDGLRRLRAAACDGTESGTREDSDDRARKTDPTHRLLLPRGKAESTPDLPATASTAGSPLGTSEPV
jgi:hypothetical protein